MTYLFRVFPWLPEARSGHPGHALFVAGQGSGRIDNPDRYRVLYASDQPAGACAEVFDYKPIWNVGMLRGTPGLPASIRALATIKLNDDVLICDLDDAARLVGLSLRPSDVVTRDRIVTRAWAIRLFEENRWGGIRWWSYYDARWGSHGVWELDALTVEAVEALTLDHPAVVEASAVLNRPIH